MAVALEAEDEITRLKEQSRILEEELQRQRQHTQQLQVQEEQAEEVVAKLRSKLDPVAAAKTARSMADEQTRLDAEAASVAAARAEVAAYRAKAAELLLQTSSVRDSTSSRIEEALDEPRSASSARLTQATSEWHREREVLNQRIFACESELSELHLEAADATQRVGYLRRRTASARLGRAAAAWKHELCVQGVQQRMRRERAAALRKLTREGEEIENEVTLCREALNREVRQEEENDKWARKERKGEVEGLKDELEELEDHIEVLEERMKQKETLADVFDMPPLSEGERIRRVAEIASGAVSSANFRGAANRLQRRAFMPGLDCEEEDNMGAGGAKKLRGSSSVPTLPRLHGGLQQLEDQIQGCRH